MNLFRKMAAKCEEYRLRRNFPELEQAFEIPSHLTVQEKCRLYLLTKDRYNIIEIGSYLGASACCFAAAMQCRGKGGQVYCIDTWNNDAMTEGCRDTWREFLDNTACYRQYIVPMRGLSTDIVGEVATRVESVDLLFIDGDHSYRGVKADWDAYRGFLKNGAIIIFHDWGWAEGVKRIVVEEVSSVVSRFDSLPNMWWGKIKK